MTLVRDGDQWRIEGQGRDRARIAWAELEEDRVVYRVESASPSLAPSRS
jgi:hypothetical protein